MKAQTQWEYKYIYTKTRTDDPGIESMLNDFGEHGWELVSVIFGDTELIELGIHSYVFKRPKL